MSGRWFAGAAVACALLFTVSQASAGRAAATAGDRAAGPSAAAGPAAAGACPAALPVIIRFFRSHGYRFVSL